MEYFLTYGHYIFWFLTILTIVVFVHEFGHYFVAKRCGVKIEIFSIGFGKEIFGYTDKSGTRWKFSLIPLGGYVKMFGDADPASTPDKAKLDTMSFKDKQVAFQYKNLKQKAAIVAAGPIFNYLLAIIIMTIIFSVHGKPHTAPIVSSVNEGSAAAASGILPMDRVLQVDGGVVESFEDIRHALSLNTGTPIDFLVQRGDKEIAIVVTPRIEILKDIYGNEVKMPLIGISSNKMEVKEFGVAESFTQALKDSYNISISILKALGQILTGERGTDDIGGPIKIAKYSGQSAQYGLWSILMFVALISINLGLFNLFPIPMLDGGHLALYAIEGATGKPVPARLQEYAFKLGFLMLVGLMIFATTNDITGLFK